MLPLSQHASSASASVSLSVSVRVSVRVSVKSLKSSTFQPCFLVEDGSRSMQPS